MNSGQFISQMRKFREISSSKLAELIGVTRQRMRAIETSSDVSFSTIQRVCAALDFEIIAIPKETIIEKKPTDINLPNIEE